jgi:hypothetical protein
VNTLARGLGPTSEASNAILDIFLAKIYDLDISAGITHALDKVIEHQFGFALAFTPGTGIKCKYSHFVLL